MNIDYVDYQTALALKECGFDEPCDHYYTNGYANHDSEDTSRVVRLHYDRTYNYNCVISADGECFSAPLLYHAQKWLREAKGLYAFPEINALKKWFARVIDLNDNEELLMDGAMFNTYEEAQSHAIKCALQFIDNREI